MPVARKFRLFIWEIRIIKIRINARDLSRLKFRVLCYFLRVYKEANRDTIIGFAINRTRCNRWRTRNRFDLANNLAWNTIESRFLKRTLKCFCSDKRHCKIRRQIVRVICAHDLWNMNDRCWRSKRRRFPMVWNDGMKIWNRWYENWIRKNSNSIYVVHVCSAMPCVLAKYVKIFSRIHLISQ